MSDTPGFDAAHQVLGTFTPYAQIRDHFAEQVVTLLTDLHDRHGADRLRQLGCDDGDRDAAVETLAASFGPNRIGLDQAVQAAARAMYEHEQQRTG